MATISEIAKYTGLSPNTVSRVLRGKIKGLRKDAVERSRLIHEAAEALGYRVNSSARAMKTGRFNAIAIVQPMNTSLGNLPEEVLKGIHEAVLEVNIHLVSSRLPDDRLTSAGFVPKILRELLVDGLLICYESAAPSEMLELIEEFAIPSIWLNVVRDFNAVRPDDAQAGRIATEHLLRMGHQRIAFTNFEHDEAFIFGNESHYACRYRYMGYTQAMQDAGLAPRLITGPFRRFSGESPQPRVETEWLEAADRPTALVAHGAWGLMRVMTRAEQLFGTAEPISIVTFGGSVVNLDDRSLDTVVLPLNRIGRAAVGMLEQRIADDKINVPSQVLPCILKSGFSAYPFST